MVSLWWSVAKTDFVLLSEDGSPKNLKEQNSSTYLLLFGVAFGGGRFVAVGDNGVIISSPDGKT
jgi:hypothetical protein